MREYDALCLAPIPAYSRQRIRALRQREIGDKHPSGPSLKLLDLLERKRLESLI